MPSRQHGPAFDYARAERICEPYWSGATMTPCAEGSGLSRSRVAQLIERLDPAGTRRQARSEILAARHRAKTAELRAPIVLPGCPICLAPAIRAGRAGGVRFREGAGRDFGSDGPGRRLEGVGAITGDVGADSGLGSDVGSDVGAQSSELVREAVTCSGECAELWRVLRGHLDPVRRRDHRLIVARYRLERDPDDSWARRVLEADGGDLAPGYHTGGELVDVGKGGGLGAVRKGTKVAAAWARMLDLRALRAHERARDGKWGR